MSGARRGPGRPRRQADDEDEPAEYGDANANMWAERLHQHQQFQAQQAQQHQEFMNMFQQHMNQPPPPQHQGSSAAFREFCRMSPPEFYGEYNPAKAIEWIQHMSGILESMDCTEVDMVVFVSRFFRCDACNWWDGTKSYMEASNMDLRRTIYPGELSIPNGT
jgi:hypothetical protein